MSAAKKRAGRPTGGGLGLTKAISVRLSPEEYDALAAEARLQQRTVGMTARILILNWLAESRR